ncbi:ATP-binding protein [uncultured Aquimarina sp.]|uniref:sensor histidine kinase n=1 Tax=uncultured Aquimarina sp. TaxID=575652 RepID=UPI00262C6973|nr:ATP-binding protein [uncultured Aquimarina sp.]
MNFKIFSFLFIFIFLLIFGCSRTKTSFENTKNSQYNDTIISLYKLGKEKKLPFTQRLDYLNKALSISNEHKKDSIFLIDIYSLKNAIFSQTEFTDSTLFYAKRMLKLSLIKKDTSKIGKAYFKLGSYHKDQSEFDSLYFYFDLSKKMFLSQNDSSQVGKRITSMSRVLLDDNDYYEAETSALEALSYLTQNDSLYRPRVYNTLGISLREQGEFEKSLIFHDSAINNTKSSKDRVEFINTKCVTLKEVKKYDQAIKLYTVLLQDPIVKKKEKLYNRIFDNLTYTKWLANNELEIEADLLNSINIRKSIKDIPGLIASNEHLMNYYSKTNIQKAKKHALELYRLTIQQNNVNDRLKALLFLKNHSNLELSKKYADLYIKISDSVNNAKEASRKKYAIMRYDSRKDRETALKLEVENAEKELLLQKKENQNILYAGSGLIILMAFVFTFFYLRTKHRKEKIMERHTTEKRLSKKLHDEVGNDVFYLMSQLQQETHRSANSANNEIIHGLDAVYNKVRDFSRDHKIETGPEYGDELLSLLNSYGNRNIKVFTNTQEDDFWTTVTNYKKVELYWILKELLTNMKKHSQANIVSVSITKEKKNIIVKYTDNGIGMDFNATQKHKNGLHNVENRIKDMKGTITFETKPQEGFKAIIEFAP